VDHDPFADQPGAAPKLIPVDHDAFADAHSAAPRFIPVDHDPFADQPGTAPKLIPVDHDPFNDVPGVAPKFIPVDYDPFAGTAITAPKLIPVDYDPFNGAPGAAPRLVPVDYDPFAAPGTAAVERAPRNADRALVSTSNGINATAARPPISTLTNPLSARSGVPSAQGLLRKLANYGAPAYPPSTAGPSTIALSNYSTGSPYYAKAGPGWSLLGGILDWLNPVGTAEANEIPPNTATAGSVLRAAIASGRITDEEAAALQARVNALSPAERLGPVIRATLPKYDGKTTYGVLITNEGQIVEFRSGSGPAWPYWNYSAAYHVEGKAAVWIRQNGSSGGVLYHNNADGICGRCNAQIERLLPEGAQLRVVSPEDAIPKNAWARTNRPPYIGDSQTPKLRPFKRRRMSGSVDEN
jgi:hypothetical protein